MRELTEQLVDFVYVRVSELDSRPMLTPEEETELTIGSRLLVEAAKQRIYPAPEREEVPLWDRDEVQFPRLLSEIAANCQLSKDDEKALCESMDLSIDEVGELFGRAQRVWDQRKAAFDV